jgi:Phosphotransferase system, mannose/fructose/N-acetylgalactosamine-specific component IIB
MIKLLRVDHRLLHGQVAFSWTQYLGADCILIANDSVMNDELRKTTIKLAKPPEVKLVIKNIADSIEAIKSGVTDKYKLFIVVESVEDAYRLSKDIAEINQINLGGTKPKDGTHNISKTINVTQEEEQFLKELHNIGKEVEIRIVPNDRKQPISDCINIQ